MRFYLSGEKTPIETLGDVVELKGSRGESFAVHPTLHFLSDDEDDLWRVSHVSTGFLAARGGTIDEAIENANRRLARVNDEQFAAALERARATATAPQVRP